MTRPFATEDVVAAALLHNIGKLLLARDRPGYVTPNGRRCPNGSAPSSARSGSPLSDRETTVLRLVADGRRNSLIAEELEMQVSTVRSHLHNTTASSTSEVRPGRHPRQRDGLALTPADANRSATASPSSS